jgi:hypothetical protein
MDPDVLNRWIAFNELYVSKTVPKAPSAIPSLVIAGIAASIGGTVSMPPVPEASAKSYAAALAAFSSTQPRVTVNFDNGNSTSGAGRPLSAFTAGFTQFPPATATAQRFYLGEGGSLQPARPATGTVRFKPDPSLRPATTGAASDFSAWAAQPDYNWAPVTGT